MTNIIDHEPNLEIHSYSYQIVCTRKHYQKTVIEEGISEIAAHAIVLRRDIMNKICNRPDCDAPLILTDKGIGRQID